MSSPREVTALLREWSRGSETALDELLPIVYGELRHMAARQLGHERANYTLQATALVHEMYLRLLGQPHVSIDEARAVTAPSLLFALALDRAPDRLQSMDPELAQIVELRAFGGLTIDEAARVLSVSPSTAKREWRAARTWLGREMGMDGRR